MQRLLIVIGAVFLIMGLLWPWFSHLGLGRLPGDVVIERPQFRFYFPIVTSLLISVVLTLLIWLFRK
jgi:membrane protein implicated in regulation of membrane protease activity